VVLLSLGILDSWVPTVRTLTPLCLKCICRSTCAVPLAVTCQLTSICCNEGRLLSIQGRFDQCVCCL
jgi:hypothetical protein